MKRTRKAAQPASTKGNGKPTAARGTKTEMVLAMLRRGATRRQIVEATGWQVDLKQFAKRKGFVLKKTAKGVISIRLD